MCRWKLHVFRNCDEKQLPALQDRLRQKIWMQNFASDDQFSRNSDQRFSAFEKQKTKQWSELDRAPSRKSIALNNEFDWVGLRVKAQIRNPSGTRSPNGGYRDSPGQARGLSKHTLCVEFGTCGSKNRSRPDRYLRMEKHTWKISLESKRLVLLMVFHPNKGANHHSFW